MVSNQSGLLAWQGVHDTMMPQFLLDDRPELTTGLLHRKVWVLLAWQQHQ